MTDTFFDLILTERVSEVQNFTEDEARAAAFGATTVLTIFNESMQELSGEIYDSLTEEERKVVGGVLLQLDERVNPRINKLREEIEKVAPPINPLLDLIEELLKAQEQATETGEPVFV